tara:strand:- start:1008 stop:1508 length:501 start_codon:yes stop_codon:yes gene_type:complete
MAWPCPSVTIERGFTVIELVVVIFLMGLLSAMVLIRFSGTSATDELGYSQELASAARYAQKLALASRCPVRLNLPSATEYSLTRPDSYVAGNCANNFNAQVVDPETGQPPYSGNAPAGLTVTANPSFPQTRTFDSQGVITPDTELLIQVGGRSIVIRSGSGLVVVQ